MLELREPAVSGTFYPGTPGKLKEMIEEFFKLAEDRFPPSVSVSPDNVVGGVAPHAGYIYSGLTASVLYRFLADRSKVPEIIAVVGPNHHGYGPEVSVAPFKNWETPFGIVEVDLASAEELVEKGRAKGLDIGFSSEAHLFEHSLEVQLPFLQYIWKGFKILPIVVKYQYPKDMVNLGLSLAEILIDRDSLLIASSDMSHYIPHQEAVVRDSRAFPFIETMDWEGLYRVISEYRITACGVGAISAVMVASKHLGATKGKVLDYTTSAMASGDYSRVVGYMSAIFFKE